MRNAILLALTLVAVTVQAETPVKKESFTGYTPPPGADELTIKEYAKASEERRLHEKYLADPVAFSKAKGDFIEYLASEAEPTVKDATFMMDRNLYVAVYDDGSSRDGFAQYVCMIAGDRGIRLDLAKVVDIVKIVREEKFVELGSSWCKYADEPPTIVKFN